MMGLHIADIFTKCYIVRFGNEWMVLFEKTPRLHVGGHMENTVIDFDITLITFIHDRPSNCLS